MWNLRSKFGVAAVERSGKYIIRRFSFEMGGVRMVLIVNERKAWPRA